jgi:hypothetical protein
MAGLVSPVRDELQWARRAAESEIDLQAAARLAEVKGMPRAAAHFGCAPLTLATLEVAAPVLNGEPVTGPAQLQPDISAAGVEVQFAERILSDRDWVQLPRTELSDAGAREVAELLNPVRLPVSSKYHLAVAVACCCHHRTLWLLDGSGRLLFTCSTRSSTIPCPLAMP